MLPLSTPDDVAQKLGQRVRAERLRQGWKQQTLAERSGVSLPTVRRFEASGRTSTVNLLKLCQALRRLDDFAEVLQPPPAASMAELAAQVERAPSRKRGRR